MFARFSNSWELVKASFAVLRADKELIIFPIVSGLAVLAVTIAFIIPMVAVGFFESVSEGGADIAGLVIAFVFYVVMYFITIFSNTALVGAALIRLRGGDPTLRDGFKIAMDHVGQIFGYAVIAATVGMLLRALRERGGLAGVVVSFIGEIAWNLATFLVVPVLVVENIGPIEAIKRSASLLKRTWGEQIIGSFSIGLVFFLLTAAAVIVIGGPVFLVALASGSVALIVVAVALVVVIIMGMTLISTTLNGIYVAALYRYATEGVVDSQYFRPDLIQNAFQRK
ncbi:MAG: hypothetical protein GYB65_01180 [Chloroflexi bacterium]|nr:hypothetical protein [Chloroflexota bacterium]